MELIVDNGKVQEPSKADKVKAAIMRDKEVYIVLPFSDVHQMVANSVLGSCSWLHKYKYCTMTFNQSDNSFTLALSVEKSQG